MAQSSMFIDSMWVMGSRFIQRGANFIVLILLARALSVAEFGYYGYVLATLLMLSVLFDLGLRQALAREIGKDGADQAAIIRDLYRLWLGLGLALTLATAALMYAFAPAHGGDALLVPVLCAALAAAPTLFVRMGQGVLLGQGRMRALNASEVTARGVLLAGTALLWLLGMLGLVEALALLLLSTLVSAVVLWRQIRPEARPTRPWSTRANAAALRGGLGFLFGALALIMLGRVGVWVLGAVLPAEELGLYVGVMRVAEMVAEIATAVGVVIFSHGVRGGDDAKAIEATAQTARTVTAIMGLTALGGALLAEQIIGIVLGSAYLPAVPAFRVCLLGAVLACQSLMLYPALSSRGLPWLGAVVMLPATAVAGLAAWYLGAQYGLIGAASAYALGQATAMVGFIVLFRRRFGLAWGATLLPRREDAAGLVAFVKRRLGGRLKPAGA